MLLETDTNEFPECLNCMASGSCEWSDWSSWSDCTTTCGPGQRFRSRTLPESNLNSVLECGVEQSNSTEWQICDFAPCKMIGSGSGDYSSSTKNSNSITDNDYSITGKTVVTVEPETIPETTEGAVTEGRLAESTIVEAENSGSGVEYSVCCDDLTSASCLACLQGIDLCEYCKSNYLGTERGRQEIPGCEQCPLIDVSIENLSYETTKSSPTTVLESLENVDGKFVEQTVQSTEDTILTTLPARAIESTASPVTKPKITNVYTTAMEFTTRFISKFPISKTPVSTKLSPKFPNGANSIITDQMNLISEENIVTDSLISTTEARTLEIVFDRARDTENTESGNVDETSKPSSGGEVLVQEVIGKFLKI